jgi:hypothetical protein
MRSAVRARATPWSLLLTPVSDAGVQTAAAGAAGHCRYKQCGMPRERLVKDHAAMGRGAVPPPNLIREYVTADQLAELTPWSVEAIKAMVRRGILVVDVHYFQPQGRGTRLIFKWSAVRAYIEAREQDGEGRRVVTAGHEIQRTIGRVIDVQQAMQQAQRLLG